MAHLRELSRPVAVGPPPRVAALRAAVRAPLRRRDLLREKGHAGALALESGRLDPCGVARASAGSRFGASDHPIESRAAHRAAVVAIARYARAPRAFVRPRVVRLVGAMRERAVQPLLAERDRAQRWLIAHEVNR